MPQRPENAAKLIRQQTKGKSPYFFIYAKDKEEWQCEQPTKSTMNRICNYIPSSRLKYSKTISKFDWRTLLNQDFDYTVRENSKIVERYNYWSKNQYKFDYGDNSHTNENELYKYNFIRDDILKYCEEDVDFIVNSLIAYVYTVKQSSNKKMLWACFGDTIVKNLTNNISGRICPICGKRFEPQKHNQMYCSRECYHESDIDKKRENRAIGVAKNP